MCMYATGCIYDSDCITSNLCVYFRTGSPFQQCLEDPQYSDRTALQSTSCLITYGVTNSGYGCTSNSQCCNPFAVCSNQQCVLQQSCIYYRPSSRLLSIDFVLPRINSSQLIQSDRMVSLI
jgi:hypothetical protein